MLFILVSLGLLLDQVLGEAKRYHPLIGFGHCANYVEKRLNSKPESSSAIALGLLGVAILVLPFSIAAYFINVQSELLSALFAVLVIYWAIGFKSLIQHSSNVANAFAKNDLELARHSTSLMVSRDTANMDQPEITRAVIESTLENGCDSTFGVLFWYIVGGVPMVIFYRLINTLDAMWGYRTQRFELFGKSAAKLDDLLNYIPARLTALSYAICGNTRAAITSWQTQAKQLASPNGGPVMTAGAGSLGVELGGPAIYHGSIINKPFFGTEKQAKSSDISCANRLVIRALLVWCFALLLLSLSLFLIARLAQ